MKTMKFLAGLMLFSIMFIIIGLLATWQYFGGKDIAAFTIGLAWLVGFLSHPILTWFRDTKINKP